MQTRLFSSQRTTIAGAILLVLGSGAATAQESPLSTVALTEGNPVLSKVSNALLKARAGARNSETRGLAEAASEGFAAVPMVKASAGRAEVEVRFDVLTPAMVEQLKGLGMEVSSVSERWARVNGQLDLESLDEVASIGEVASIHPNYGHVTWSGTPSEGDASIRASDARTTLGVDGTGVTVGVISDSINNLSNGTNAGGSENPGACDCSTPGSTCFKTVTGMPNQTSMDLPASITTLDDCTMTPAEILTCGTGSPHPCCTLTREGAALGEIVHDLAPGAGQMFHTASRFISDFATGITELANCGADVIVDDVIFLAEPMFQNGPIAQAAQAAVDSGVSYFSSAGNSGTFGVMDDYLDSNATDDTTETPPSGNDFHDFGGGERFASITVPASCTVTAALQWSEPFSGALGAGASSDLDLYFCTAKSPASCPDAFASKTRQGCGMGGGASGDPLELGGVVNMGGAAATIWIAVEHHCSGSEDLEFRIATFSSCGITSPTFDSGIYKDAQIYGHAAAAGVVAVAAVDYLEINTPGATKDVEAFSSLGGALPFYFDGSGTALGPISSGPGPLTPPPAPTFRNKPDVAAPDGVTTTIALFNPFFGTSAAAPHAAAVAALMQHQGNLSPSGLSQVLGQSARDWESMGFDFLSGYGVIDGLDSVGTTFPSAPGCFIDHLELLGKPNTGTQEFRTCTSLTVGGGDFSDVTGISPSNIFADGFESGNTSAWTN